MVELGLQITRSILFDDVDRKKQLDFLKEKQKSLIAEKTSLLKKNNYPANYLEAIYNCIKCKDTGFAGLEKCSCLVQKQIEYNYVQSNLAQSTDSFETFNINYYSDTPLENGLSPKKNMKQIYLKSIKFVQDFDSHNENLLFIGRPGLGKTFLCLSIAKELLKAGKSVIYQTAPDLTDLIRKRKFDFDNEEENDMILDNLNTCDLLIIDDLGTELSTQFSSLVIFNILNKRLLKSKSTIIATNLDVNEILRDYSERITSRIFGNFHMYEFFGDDIRLLMKIN